MHDCLCPIPQEVELTKEAASCLMWMLGIELGSSARLAQVLSAGLYLSSPKIEHFYVLQFMLDLSNKLTLLSFIFHICLGTKIDD